MKMTKFKVEGMKAKKWTKINIWMMIKQVKWKECMNKKNRTIWIVNNMMVKVKTNNKNKDNGLGLNLLLREFLLILEVVIQLH